MENHVQNADPIASLPTNMVQPSYNELKIVDTLFKQHGSAMDKIAEETKSSVIVGILFIMFSLTQLDDLIKRFLPITRNSPYILMLIKALALSMVFWIINNFWLSRKCT